MHLYYNTNGFAGHRLDDIVAILADLGYDGVALTPDVHHLDPLRTAPGEVERFRRRLEDLGLGATIEGGSRYVLDPRRKHHPTLLSRAEHGRRQEFYRKLIDLAAALGSPLISIWSGRSEPDTPPGESALTLLAERLRPVLEHAAARDVLVCCEPEPGMRVAKIADFERLRTRLGGLDLWLTIDTGHLAATEQPPYDEHIRAHSSLLRNLHLDDSPRGTHEHRFFGEGAVEFSSIAAALDATSYRGVGSVELPRHSSEAPDVAARALTWLRRAGF